MPRPAKLTSGLVAPRGPGRAPTRGATRLVAAVLLSLVLAAEALAQPAVVTRNVNLRQDPSTANPRIMLLIPGDELVLLEPEKTNGYFHVRTASGEEGWAFGNRVRVLEEEADEPGPTSGPPEVFRGCGPEGNAQHAFRRELNRLKNRNTIPRQVDLDTAITLAAMLAPGDDTDRWSTESAALIVGYR